MISVRHTAATGEAEEETQGVIIGFLVYLYATFASKDQGSQSLVARGIEQSAGDVTRAAVGGSVSPAPEILAGAECVAALLECRQDPLVARGEVVFAEEDATVANSPDAGSGFFSG